MRKGQDRCCWQRPANWERGPPETRIRLHHPRSHRAQTAEKALRRGVRKRFRAQVTASFGCGCYPDAIEIASLRGRDFITGHRSAKPLLASDIHSPGRSAARCWRPSTKLSDKSTFELEHQILRVDGTLGWTFSRAVPLQDANGDIVEWLGAASDITGRKLAEEALTSSVNCWKVTLQSIGDAVLATRCRRQSYLPQSRCGRLTGWAEQEALGRPARDVLRTIDELTRESGEEHSGARVTGSARRSMANHTVLLAATGVRYRSKTAPAPIRDSAGNLLGVVLVFHDVTEKRRAQQALRASEWRLRTLSDNLPEGAIFRYSHDVQGQPHVDFISAGIEQLTGVPAAEFMADAATVYRNILLKTTIC